MQHCAELHKDVSSPPILRPTPLSPSALALSFDSAAGAEAAPSLVRFEDGSGAMRSEEAHALQHALSAAEAQVSCLSPSHALDPADLTARGHNGVHEQGQRLWHRNGSGTGTGCLDGMGNGRGGSQAQVRA